MPKNNGYKNEILKRWRKVFPVIDVAERLKKNTMHDKAWDRLKVFKKLPLVGIEYSPVIDKKNKGKIEYIYIGSRSFLAPSLFLDKIGDKKLKKQLDAVIEILALLRSFGKDATHILRRSNGEKGGQYLLLNGSASTEFVRLISIAPEKPRKRFCSACAKKRDITFHHIIPKSALKKFAETHEGVMPNFKGNLIPLCEKCHRELEMLITIHTHADLENLEEKKYDKTVEINEEIYIADAMIILAKFIIGKILKSMNKEKLLNELVEFEIEEVSGVVKKVKNLKLNHL